MRGLTIKSAGTPRTTQLLFNGEVIPGVKDIDISKIAFDSGRLTAAVNLYVDELNINIPVVEGLVGCVSREIGYGRDSLELILKGESNE